MIQIYIPSLISLAVLVVMIIFTFMDFKTKTIPAMLTSGVIIGLAVFMPERIIYAAIMFIFGYFLYESNYIGGWADIKVLVIIGLLLNSIDGVLVSMILVFLFGILWKLFSKKVLKYKNETPFLIVFTITLLMLIIARILGFYFIV